MSSDMFKGEDRMLG